MKKMKCCEYGSVVTMLYTFSVATSMINDAISERLNLIVIFKLFCWVWCEASPHISVTLFLGTRDSIHNTSYSSYLTNRPNKRKNYITLGLEGLQMSKRSSLFRAFVNYKENNCREYFKTLRIHIVRKNGQISY
jgi:hypothetical protein